MFFSVTRHHRMATMACLCVCVFYAHIQIPLHRWALVLLFCCYSEDTPTRANDLITNRPIAPPPGAILRMIVRIAQI
jgi:hypothetical protein